MAISKNSVRVQFTLNRSKEKENQIIEFLEGYIDPNSMIKEILYNYIVSNNDTKLPKVTHSEVIKNDSELLKMSNSELLNNNVIAQSKEKSVKVSDLEKNELEELSKFI